jgi:hypothetical protein
MTKFIEPGVGINLLSEIKMGIEGVIIKVHASWGDIYVHVWSRALQLDAVMIFLDFYSC